MERIATGISISVPAEKRGGAGSFARALPLHGALSLCFASMLGAPGALSWIAALLPGMAILFLFSLVRSAAARKALALSCGAAIVLWLAIDQADGLAQIANRLFAASEARQKYAYDYFPASESATRRLLALAMTSLAAGTSLASGGKPASLILLALLLGAQIYLGVFAADIWNLLLILAFAIALADFRKGFALLLCAAAAVLAAAVLFLPAANEGLSQLSEEIRDRFGVFLDSSAALQGEGGEKDPASSPAGRRREAESALLREGENVGEGEREFETLYDPSFSGARAGMARRILSAAAALFIACLLLLLIPFFRYLRRRRANQRMVRRFASAPPAEAMDEMFRYAMRWLRAGTKLPVGAPYGDYPLQIPWAEDCGFSEMLCLWESAHYGKRPPAREDRERMREFMERVIAQIREKSNWRERLWMRLILYPPPAGNAGKGGKAA